MTTQEFYNLIELDIEGEPYVVAYCDIVERISEPYWASLCLLVDAATKPKAILDLVGKRATVGLREDNEAPNPARFLYGVVTEAILETRVLTFEGPREITRAVARVTIEPAFALLQMERSARIYQKKNTYEIVTHVLEGLPSGLLDASKVNQRDLIPFENRVLFDESHLNFVSRLLEAAGISYYFTHDLGQGIEKMVLVNEATDFVQPPRGVIKTHRTTTGLPARHSNWVHIHHAQRFVPEQTTMRGFNWTTHSEFTENQLAAGRPSTQKSGNSYHYARASLYEYSAPTYGKNDAAFIAKLAQRRQEVEANLRFARSGLLDAVAGAYLDLEIYSGLEDVTQPEKAKLLVVGAVHRASQLQEGVEIDGRRGVGYGNELELLPDAVGFLPPLVHAPPVVPGLQTATVVAPQGNDIYTEDWGRVRVRFHWNSEPKDDNPDNNSCWLTTVQAWAGANYGVQFVPRAGMEVVVAFMDGDLDRPMVVGCIPTYNNMLPFDPTDKPRTMSGIRTHSQRSGAAVEEDNELSFDDRADEEKVYLRARKDLDVDVLNTADFVFEARENNDPDGLPVVHALVKKGDFVATMERDSKTEIQRDSGTTVRGNCTREVDGTDDTVVKQKRTEDFKADVERTVGGGLTETVTGSVSETWRGNADQSVMGSKSVSVTGQLSQSSNVTFKATCGSSSLKLNPVGVDLSTAGVEMIKGTLVKIN